VPMQIEQGMVIEGKVTGVTNFGAFVALPEGKSGMVHISEVSSSFVRDINEFVKVGDTVKVMVLSIDEKGKIALSIKRAAEADTAQPKRDSRGQGQGSADRRMSNNSQYGQGTPMSPPADFVPLGRRRDPSVNTFEDMMSKFKADSNEKFSDLKRSADSKRSGGYPKPQRKSK